MVQPMLSSIDDRVSLLITLGVPLSRIRSLGCPSLLLATWKLSCLSFPLSNAGDKQDQYGAVLFSLAYVFMSLNTSENLQFDKLERPVAHAWECAIEYFAPTCMSIEPCRVTDVRTIYIYTYIYNSRTATPSMWGSLRLAPIRKCPNRQF
jgi:hypothetical protein